MALWIGITLLALLALLASEFRESQVGKWITKPLASTGFLLTAYQAGAWNTAYGQWIFVALVLSWFGDVFLIPKSRRAFLFGLISFLLGHLAFAVAFLQFGIHGVWAGSVIAIVLIVGIAVGFWLKPHVESGMWVPVIAYIIVISSMVVTAVGSYGIHRIVWIPWGAILFYVSDLAVARNRFVAPSFFNRLWGLPCYYVAQLILAWSCSLVPVVKL